MRRCQLCLRQTSYCNKKVRKYKYQENGHFGVLYVFFGLQYRGYPDNGTNPTTQTKGPRYSVHCLVGQSWMWLRAFPASTGPTCCLGSGDWPLDPHEIVLHPRDLDKLRVAAFGYVAVSRSCSNDRSRTNTINTRNERSPPSVHTNVDTGIKKKEEEHLTFCRAFPDDSLAPGEMRAPAWLMRAAGVRPRQHLAVARAAAPASTVLARSSAEEPPLDFRLEISPVCSGSQGDNGDLRGTGSEHPTEGELQQSRRSTSARATAGGMNQKHCRAIARRLSACMVRVGSLLAAEVLGEIVVMRVSAIRTDRNSGSGSGDGDGGGGGGPRLSSAENSCVSGDIRDGARRRGSRSDMVDIDDKGLDMHGHDDDNAPRLITSTTEVYVVNSSGDTRSGTRVSSDVRQGTWGHGQGQRRRPLDQTPPVRERFDTRCGGEQEAWTRRAPGLEPALRELHGLVLLSVGGLNQAVSGQHGARVGDRVGENGGDARAPMSTSAPPDLSPAFCNSTLAAAPPPPRRQPRQTRASGSDGGRGSRGGSGSSGGNLLRWADVLPANIVLCGPSGVGKTLALDVLSEDLRERHGVHVVRLLGPQVLAGFSSGSREHGTTSSLAGPLAVALLEARSRVPAVLVLDELDVLFDAIGGDEGVPLGEGSRAIAALLEALDRASEIEGVTMLAATRRTPGGRGGAGWAGLEEGNCAGGDGAAMPAAFRKPGRFDRCVSIGPPTQADRAGILRVLLVAARGWALEPLVPPAPTEDVDVLEQPEIPGRESRVGVDAKLKGRPSPSVDGQTRERWGAVEKGGGRSTGDPGGSWSGEGHGVERGVLAEWARRLSSVTPGMVAGDLERLVRTARARAAQRARSARSASQSLMEPKTGDSTREALPSPAQQLERQPLPLTVVTWRDAMGAVAATVPRSLRGMEVASSGAGGGGPTWGSVGGFSEAKHRLQRLVQWPWLHPEAFARMGVSAPAGALLCGPSGCGKSLVAQVLATECLANFVWVRSSELLSRCARKMLAYSRRTRWSAINGEVGRRPQIFILLVTRRPHNNFMSVVLVVVVVHLAYSFTGLLSCRTCALCVCTLSSQNRTYF